MHLDGDSLMELTVSKAFERFFFRVLGGELLGGEFLGGEFFLWSVCMLCRFLGDTLAELARVLLLAADLCLEGSASFSRITTVLLRDSPAKLEADILILHRVSLSDSYSGSIMLR